MAIAKVKMVTVMKLLREIKKMVKKMTKNLKAGTK